MATYYRWRKSSINYTDRTASLSKGTYISKGNPNVFLSGSRPSINQSTGKYIFSGELTDRIDNVMNLNLNYFAFSQSPTEMFRCESREGAVGSNVYAGPDILVERPPVNKYTVTSAPGTFQGYVYSTSSGAYPNGGVSGGYYYDQRAAIINPRPPRDVTYPNPITTSPVTVNWITAGANISEYPVKLHQVTYSVNGGASWVIAGNKTGNPGGGLQDSLEVNIPAGTTSIQFRVRVQDSNNQWSDYATGPEAQVLLSPTLTVPELAMQGQSVAVSWSELEGADSYTLQRKADTDADWVQVYTGAGLTFTETAGAWTSVQYRVQAVFGGVPGGWAASEAIPVVSAAALVISGQDGDLGTIVNDVPYSVSTDTGKQIRLTLLVNGAEVYTRTIDSGYANRVLILDLAAGTGTITLKAEVQADSGTVSAVRSWTYTKAAIPFETGRVDVMRLLDAGGTAQYPATVAEAVRLPGGKTLDQVTQYPAQVVTGSYVGTGTHGKDNPNTLMFPFEPKLVVIQHHRLGDSYSLYMLYGVETTSGNYHESNGTVKITWNSKTVSWYANLNDPQMNVSGETYHYFALG